MNELPLHIVCGKMVYVLNTGQFIPKYCILFFTCHDCGCQLFLKKNQTIKLLRILIHFKLIVMSQLNLNLRLTTKRFS